MQRRSLGRMARDLAVVAGGKALATVGVVLGRFFRVARPDDWTGTLSRLTIGTAVILLGIAVALVRLPPGWLALAGGKGWVVRLVVFAVVLLFIAAARALLIARLPRAAVLLGKTVRFHDGTRRMAVHVDEVRALHVESRPPPLHEVFVIEQYDGAEHDICPSHWWGAPRLHRTLERKMVSAQQRRTRRIAAERIKASRAARADKE